MKKTLILILSLLPMFAMAQSGTNSPYSQYGLGLLHDQSTGFNRGMNGLGIAMHESGQINTLNPASLSCIDSLTFVFDVGASAQLTNFKEGTRKKNAQNANFEYAVMGFRVAKNLGVSLGILPFSNVGYNYHSEGKVKQGTSTTIYTTSYTGAGGVRQVYGAAGWSPINPLSVGMKFAYVWGDYTRTVDNFYSDLYANSVSRYYKADMSSWKLDFGVQYTHKLSTEDNVTIGATFSPSVDMNGAAELYQISTNPQTYVADTTRFSHDKALFLPTTYGVGLSWYHTTKWRVGVDYTLQQWSKKSFPDFRRGEYLLVDDVLKDRHKLTVGGEYVHNALSRRYLNRVHFRAGFSYATPYIKVNGQDGPNEISASLGVGLPITNSWNNRSTLNIAAQWCRNAATGMIRENIFRINVGITFNERWFMKWKLE